jgi:plastocyanin
VRIHRLHLPPPPVGDDTTAPGKPSPTAPPAPPGTTSPPPAPSPPGAQPPPPVSPPPPASGVTCTTAGDVAGADVTGTLTDYVLALSAASVASAPTLRFRGVYPLGGADVHNLTLRDSNGTTICGTGDLQVGGAGTFTVTNLPPGTYQLVCTIHVAFFAAMGKAFTVN